VDGGAWPFLVGGVICLVNSDNERDSPLLTSRLDLAVAFLVQRYESCTESTWVVATCERLRLRVCTLSGVACVWVCLSA